MRRAAFVLVLFAAGRAAANPIDAFGFGSRAAAMGNAATAAAVDIAANYYNPAGIAVTQQLAIDVGYQIASPHMSWNDRDAGVDDTRGTYMGMVVPGKIRGVEMALGTALFLPDERLTRVKSEAITEPRFIYYDNRTQRLFLAANLGFRVAPTVWIGGGLVWMSRTQGTVDLTGRIGFPDAEQSDLRLSMNYDLEAVRYPQFGVLWRARSDLWLGLTYRAEFELDLAQTFRVEGDVGSVSAPVIRNGFIQVASHSTDLFQPGQLAAGMAFNVTPRWLTTADVIYEHWSGFSNPGAQIDLTHDLKDFEKLVHIPATLPPQAPFFHDILVLRAGFEHGLPSHGERTQWLVRGGYSFEPSPVPEQWGETSFADGNKHTFSTGAGVVIQRVPCLPQPLAIDAHLAWTWMPSRTTLKSRETDPVGDFTAEGWVLATGLTARVRF
jgi:long-chain fatty acid transport protein